jgi:hypothetical protein
MGILQQEMAILPILQDYSVLCRTVVDASTSHQGSGISVAAVRLTRRPIPLTYVLQQEMAAHGKEEFRT